MFCGLTSVFKRVCFLWNVGLLVHVGKGKGSVVWMDTAGLDGKGSNRLGYTCIRLNDCHGVQLAVSAIHLVFYTLSFRMCSQVVEDN